MQRVLSSVQPPMASTIALSSAAELSTILIPAGHIASIFSSAPPLPPEMIALAWPIRRPGGAACSRRRAAASARFAR